MKNQSDLSGLNISSGFSDYWRRNKSPIENRELAYALRALRKVGEYIATNFKILEWVGMSEPDKNKILLDCAFALGEYPIPAGKMDILVGVAAHEAFHCKEWSDWVWMKVEERHKELHPTYRSFLHRLVEMGEDIYVNQAAEGSIWKNYIVKAWSWCLPKSTRDLSLPPTPKVLFQIWGGLILEGEYPESIHPDYLEPLDILLSYVDEIVNSNGRGSILSRSDCRIKLYLDLWEKVNKFFTEWELEDAFEQEAVGIPDERGRKEDEDSFEEEEEEFVEDEDELSKATKIRKTQPRDLFPQIKSSLIDNTSQDLTPLVEVACEDYNSELINTLFWNSTYPCNTVPDPMLVMKLRRIFEMQVSKSSKFERRLYAGKLDGRRLYRASLSGRIFKKKKFFFDDYWNITVLVDSSLSMRGNMGADWKLTENTFAALYEAAKNSSNRLDVLCYFERAQQCEVVRLLHSGKLHSIVPNGRTPTGQGIIAAALKMPKDKRRLIIHVTDGEPNCGVSVDQALKFCRKNGIELITVGCGYNEQVREQFQNQYGSNLFLIDSIEQLPKGLEILLRRKLLQ